MKLKFLISHRIISGPFTGDPDSFRFVYLKRGTFVRIYEKSEQTDDKHPKLFLHMIHPRCPKLYRKVWAQLKAKKIAGITQRFLRTLSWHIKTIRLELHHEWKISVLFAWNFTRQIRPSFIFLPSKTKAFKATSKYKAFLKLLRFCRHPEEEL